MKNRSPIFPIILVFVVVNGALIALRSRLLSGGFDQSVLIWGNIFLFGLSIISFNLNKKALKAEKTAGFLKYFYLGFLIKFFVVIIAVAIYALSVPHVNKPAILTCMGLYLVYTFIETRQLLKESKQKDV